VLKLVRIIQAALYCTAHIPIYCLQLICGDCANIQSTRLTKWVHRADIAWRGGWVGETPGVDAVLISAGNQTQAFQTVACPYTDWATSALLAFFYFVSVSSYPSLRWPRDTLYALKVVLTLPRSGGRSVGIIRWRTKVPEFVLFVCSAYPFIPPTFLHFFRLDICPYLFPLFFTLLLSWPYELI
jgi:hypothetical protein